MKRRWRQLVLISAAVSALAVGVGVAANPSANPFSYGTCNAKGLSSFIWSPGNYAQSDTRYNGGSCTDTWHVHAYYWGSDSQWHYEERTTSASPAATSYWFWTDNVWGYHKYPAWSGTTNTTNAY